MIRQTFGREPDKVLSMRCFPVSPLRVAAVVLAAVLLPACEQQGSVPAGSVADPTSLTHGPKWSALQAIVPPANAFNVSAIVQPQIKLGDAIEIKVRSARDGYLHIVQIDATDAVSTLLPNSVVTDNRIQAGQEYTFPAAGSNLKLRAQEPVGESLLAFVVTCEKFSTEQVFPELFGKPGKGLASADSSTGGGAAPWPLARYTINVDAC